MTQRYQSGPENGLLGTYVRPQQTQPDYGGAIDSISRAFENTRDGIVRRAMMQQQAQNQQLMQQREQQQMETQQQRQALREQEYIGKLSETHNEVDPNSPNIGPDGKPLSLVRVGNRAFAVDPTKTKEGIAAAAKADRVKVLTSLGGDLKPADIEILSNNQPAFDSYVSAHYGPTAQRIDPNGPEARAAKLADQKSLAQTVAALRAPTESTQIVQGNDAQGNPVFYRIPKQGPAGPITGVTPKVTGASGAAGVLKDLPAPMAAKVGQFGEMLKKSADLLPAMEQLNVSLGQSGAQDVAANGIGVGHARIPGTQGLGSLMVNRSPEYATYQAALSPFVLAAAHALSGARINQDQITQIRSSIEIKPGDSPSVRAQKHRNLIDLTNSIGGSLPAHAIAAQEDQMDPSAVALLRGNGYKPVSRGDASPVAAPETSNNPFLKHVPKK